jgi:hypothetical protein
MSDLPKPPTKPENPDLKGDKDDAKGGIALPKNQQLSTSQKVFIWSMVVFVGILFGAGPITDQLLGQGSQGSYVNNVSEIDIIARQGVARRLQDALNPQRHTYFGGEMFEPAAYDRSGRPQNVQEIWAERIKLSRYAKEQGLQPDGTALKALLKEFLNKPMPGNSGKRYADVLVELHGEKAVTEEQLKQYLAEARARDFLEIAKVVAPAVPIASGEMINALEAMTQVEYRQGKKGDQVVVDEVILSAKSLLSEVKDDDVEIQQEFDKLKDSRFTRALALETTVAYADLDALAAKAVVADSDIEAYYNAHKENYRKPVEPQKVEEKKPEEKIADAATPAEPKPEEKKPEEKKPEVPVVEYKALAEVSAEIKAILAKERATSNAKELVNAFAGKTDALLNLPDNTQFKAEAINAGLVTTDKFFIEAPKSGGTLDAGMFGNLNETQLHLFNQEKGSITLAVQSTGEGDKARWLVLRIDGRREAGFRDLTDPKVKEEVKSVLAGKRAYKELLTKAEEIRAAAEKLGPGGLKKWAESEEAKKWNVVVTSNTRSALTQIDPPPIELGARTLAEGKLLAAMAMPERVVALGDSPTQADVPAVRLVQATDYQPAPKASGQARIDHANVYRDLLENYRYSMFQRELTAELQKN